MKIDSIDETIIVNKSLPKAWRCPHCGKHNKFGLYSNDIFMEHFKLIDQCGHCGYLHYWELQLTDDFKKGVMDMLMNGDFTKG